MSVAPQQEQSDPTLRPGQARRTVVAVSLAVGLSIQGDSLLYGILPLAAVGLGISPPLVGVLLSANRLVRLLSNSAAASLFERQGPRQPFMIATILGLVTAALYGVGSGFTIFLVARIGWGIAWSALRQGTYQAVWAGGLARMGGLMGLSWGIIRAGSAVSVVAGGWIWDSFGYRPAVFTIAAITALAIPVAWWIRWPLAARGHIPGAQVSKSGTLASGVFKALADPRQRWLLLMGFLKLLLDSVLVSTASIFLADRLGGTEELVEIGIGLGTAAGAVLAIRWLSDLVAGPIFGTLSDRTGQFSLALVLLLLLYIGLIGAASNAGLTSLLFLALSLIVSTGVNVTLDAAANRAALASTRPHQFVGLYTTVSDLGSAAGPLFAFSASGILGLTPIYLTLAGLTGLVIVRIWLLERT